MNEDDASFRLAGHVFRFVQAPIVLPLGGLDCELTDAEVAVVQLACRGLTNAEIARLRSTSQRTVANQLASIYGKLAVGGRGELVALFARVR